MKEQQCVYLWADVGRNSRTLLRFLMRCAADTLLILGGDPKRLGVRLGVTTVLHHWTRTLQYHPHVHDIVTGDGLSTAAFNMQPIGRR